MFQRKLCLLIWRMITQIGDSRREPLYEMFITTRLLLEVQTSEPPQLITTSHESLREGSTLLSDNRSGDSKMAFKAWSPSILCLFRIKSGKFLWICQNYAFCLCEPFLAKLNSPCSRFLYGGLPDFWPVLAPVFDFKALDLHLAVAILFIVQSSQCIFLRLDTLKVCLRKRHF